MERSVESAASKESSISTCDYTVLLYVPRCWKPCAVACGIQRLNVGLQLGMVEAFKVPYGGALMDDLT